MIPADAFAEPATAPAARPAKRRQRRHTQLVPLLRPEQLAALSAAEPAPPEPGPAALPPAPDQRELPPDPLTLIQLLGLLTAAAAQHLAQPDRETGARYLGLVERARSMAAAILADAEAVDPLRDLDIEVSHAPGPRGRA